jgi:ATP-binding cassette, subfamily B, bacterial
MQTDGLYSELYNISDELLNSDRQVRLRVGGYSMYPFLRNGDIITISKCSLDELKKGDIIVFKSGNRWIAHRLLIIKSSENKNSLVSKGDTCRRKDPVISEENFIGKVISYSRKGKESSIENKKAEKKNRLLINLSFIRTPLLIVALFIMNFTKKLNTHSISLKKNILFLAKGSKKLVWVNVIISTLQGAMPFIIIYLIKLLIDAISKAGTHSDKNDVLNTIIFLIVLTGTAFLLNSILTLINGYYRERLSQSLSIYIYNLLHKKHTILDMAYLEDSAQQDKIHRAVQEAGFRPLKIITEGLSGMQAVVSLLFILFIFLKIHWIVFFLLLLAVTPGFIVRLKFSKKLYNFNKSNSQNERKTYYFNRILTSISFAKEIRLFGLGDYFSKKYLSLQEYIHSNKNILLRKRLILDIIAQSFAVILIFLSFAYVTNLAVKGILSMGTVVLFFMVFQRGFVVFKDMFQSLAGLYEDNVFLGDFFDFLNLPEFYRSKKENKKNQSLEKGITFENVSFKYPSSKRNAIDSVSMTIPTGKTIALVGANGSGKTTLIKMICGFYQPDQGQILFDGKNISAFSPEELRKQITAVFQDFALYNLSAAENIFMGDITKPLDISAIRKAAINAGIDDVLQNLPFGYDNLLGNLFEKGEELSIGQWQKIAIAKAFYRDSSFLILDEPSSALDAETEKQLLENLKSLSKNKTVLIISHRLSSIQWADTIIVLENGKITETGTHDGLMAQKAGYFKMFETYRAK